MIVELRLNYLHEMITFLQYMNVSLFFLFTATKTLDVLERRINTAYEYKFYNYKYSSIYKSKIPRRVFNF
jgi:hypothetical protein